MDDKSVGFRLGEFEAAARESLNRQKEVFNAFLHGTKKIDTPIEKK